MASIKKRGNKYLITVSKGYITITDENGKEKKQKQIETTSFTIAPDMTELQNKKAAEEFAADFEKRLKLGMPIIRESKNGSYYTVSVETDRTDKDGNRIIEATDFHPDPNQDKKQNMKELYDFAAAFEKRVKSGLSRGDAITFRAFAESWMNNYASSELEKSTFASYRNILDKMLYPQCGEMILSDIKPSTVQGIINSIREKGYCYGNRKGKYSEETLRGMKICLSSILSAAEGDGIISRNPCTIRQRKGKKEVKEHVIKCFSPDQARRFLTEIENPIPVKVPAKDHNRGGKIVHINEYYGRPITVSLMYQAIFNVAIYSGCRLGEIVGLTWCNVDFTAGTIFIKQAASHPAGEKQFIKTPKTQAGFRKIYLPQSVMKYLKAWKTEQAKQIIALGTAWTGDRKQTTGYVFTSETGEMLDIQTPSKKFKSVLRGINENITNEADKLPDIHFHDCRHTAASILIASGMDAVEVARRLGHADSITTLKIYSHAFEESDRKAADALERAITGNSAVRSS